MRAALPMYDRPELAEAHCALWRLIRANLGYGPDSLEAPENLWELWQAPDLLFAQTCGYPYRASLHNKVQLVGTPDYGLPDTPPGHYYSVIVVRADDPRTTMAEFACATTAYNEALSQSGWAALAYMAAAHGVSLGTKRQTGAHRASALAVADGLADLAAIDAVTWRFMTRYEGWTDRLRVLVQTPPTPGLPYITGPTGPVEALRDAIGWAITELSTAHLEALGITGLIQIPSASYLAVPTPPKP